MFSFFIITSIGEKYLKPRPYKFFGSTFFLNVWSITKQRCVAVHWDWCSPKNLNGLCLQRNRIANSKRILSHHCGLSFKLGTHYTVQNISLFNFLFRNSGRQLVAPTEPETYPFRTVQNQRTIDDNVIEDSIDNRQEPMNLRTVFLGILQRTFHTLRL